MKTSTRVLAVCAAAAVFLVHADGRAQQKSAPNKKLIVRGKWLVNVGGCNDCHSPKKFGPKGPEVDETQLLSGAPSHAPIPEIPKQGIGMGPDKWAGVYSADLTTWVGPWGISFAANLSPDIETGTGSWTDAVFMKALRSGKHLGEGRPILPPMPWENFARLDDSDLKAIFGYLKSIPPVKNAVHEPIPPSAGEMK